jgi:uncharacterized protein
MDIEWDPGKARTNRSKHGVSFADVEPAFYDPFALSMPDTFSATEERFVLVGTDALGRILTVSYTYRGETIRIISARPATKTERKEYEKGIRL